MDEEWGRRLRKIIPRLSTRLFDLGGFSAMTGSEFLACAERLAASKHEADLRSAVSRAYYAAFHEAQALLRDCGVRLPRTEQAHVKMTFCLQDCGEAVAEEVGHSIEFLRNQRKVADYELDNSRFTDAHRVQTETARARRVKDNLDRCRKSATFATRLRNQARLLGLPVSE